jgi:hypothetical protein
MAIASSNPTTGETVRTFDALTGEQLEHRFADLVERSGVAYADYARDTARLLDALDAVAAAGR